jgi:hypothetical protein
MPGWQPKLLALDLCDGSPDTVFTCPSTIHPRPFEGTSILDARGVRSEFELHQRDGKFKIEKKSRLVRNLLFTKGGKHKIELSIDCKLPPPFI